MQSVTETTTMRTPGINPAEALAPPCILTINGGSSSIKFALYQVGEPLQRGLYGKVDRIGLSGTSLTFTDPDGKPQPSLSITASDHKSAADFLIDWLEKRTGFESVRAVGHRVVHGMKHTAPEVVTQELLDELHRIRPYDPEHLPREIELIEAFLQRHPQLPQLACFDTAFHRDMPRVARLLPIPRRFEAKGVQRYGFHGLSYAYLMEELLRLGDPAATAGRVILAHLGNGASLAAVRAGKSIDTSMGFTPTAGLVMSTRSGDLDPGLAPYLARTEQITTSQFYKMVNHESGLLGVSETSSDMRDLLAREKQDVRAAEAVAVFCYQVKKWIGAFAAALCGLDTLVFAGGIGENAPLVRARICEGLGFFGIELNESRNAETAAVISTDASRVTVRVIRTDEELMIARSVLRSPSAVTTN
jgi:acetate kinase